jgi:hypothetical protein
VPLLGHARGGFDHRVDDLFVAAAREQALQARAAQAVEPAAKLGLEDNGGADEERRERVVDEMRKFTTVSPKRRPRSTPTIATMRAPRSCVMAVVPLSSRRAEKMTVAIRRTSSALVKSNWRSTSRECSKSGMDNHWREQSRAHLTAQARGQG